MTLRPYIAAFFITSAIFLAAFGVSYLFNTKRLEELRTIEERLALDILSLETQFDLFEAVSCSQLKENNPITAELSELGAKLAFTEGELGADDPRVVQLKKTYTLLSIKDLILLRRVKERCGFGPMPILYFYSNKPNACTDCERQGYVLTRLAREIPEVRIYSFDYDLPLPALNTLEAIAEVEPPLPVVQHEGVTLRGFHNFEELLDAIPPLRALRDAKQETAASSSPAAASSSSESAAKGSPRE
ncbi:hypothetical protein D6792_03740 [Candidatus Parcubacteria bacterium]|nr:MAG: hypothetical protein D6792_03740 [Candidatus Parcubacteria bacterium]GIW69092.1 MAG: hypothetical protein KatS3mg100_586 [Candidatus Parcubacteria bacterium]